MLNPEKGFSQESIIEETPEKPETTIEQKEKEPKPHFDAVIVFGAGIRDIEQLKSEIPSIKEQTLEDFESLIKKDPAELTRNEQIRKARMLLPIMAKMRSLAALEILKNGDIDELIITGGQVKGGGIPSEAELMKDYILHSYRADLNKEVRKKIDNKGEGLTESQAQEKIKEFKAKIKTEERATNTVENFAHTVNMIDEEVTKDASKYQNMAFLSNQFHLERIGIIADKFLVKGKTTSAEEGLANRYSKKETTTKHYQRFLDNSCNSAGYKGLLGAEPKWIKAMEEILMYWFPQAVVVNQERLEDMCEALKKSGLTEEELLNLTPEKIERLKNMSPEQKSKERIMPPEEWAGV